MDEMVIIRIDAGGRHEENKSMLIGKLNEPRDLVTVVRRCTAMIHACYFCE